VWGVVTEAGTGEPMIDATVTVVGTARKATADLDGRYRLELPPGAYELRVWYELHQARRVQNVRVVAGGLQRVDVALEPDRAAEEVFVVEGQADRSSQAALLRVRKDAAAASDGVSAQEIARTPDRSAAEAARRVVGATIVGGRYVYVRGLGERYSNALLNGAPLPSAEPDRQAVPLDLFPALALSDITILKTFTPDMPGDFAGGSVRIQTRQMPEDLVLQATLSAGLNTESTFADRLTYTGSSMDWLGVDGGARALPAEIPDYKIVRPGKKPNGEDITKEEVELYGRKLNAVMSPSRTTNWPNLGGNVVIGDSWSLGGDRRLGALAALTYGRRFTTRSGEILRTYRVDEAAGEGALVEKNDYRAETGLDQVSWGALAGVSVAIAKGHTVGITALHSRQSDNEARVIHGFNEERGADITDTRLRFTTRSMTFGGLRGEHDFPAISGELDWHLDASLATSDEPDTRETVYVEDATSGVASWDKGTLSGSHLFTEQGETAYGGGLDWTERLAGGERPVSLKLGAFFQRRSRELDARRFRFLPKSGTNPEIFKLPADELFTNENIGPVLYLEEWTRPNDAYDASHDLNAVYVMSDAAVTRRVRVVVGARLEDSTQTIDSYDPYAPVDAAGGSRVRAELATTDLLPSLGFIVKATEASNVRLSLARTVARPQIRELAPFAFIDYFGAREVMGNPDLDRTSIYAADARFEVFPSPGEVLAVSAFYKRFVDPIEPIVIPTGIGVVSYDNAEGATAIGLELEAKKGLGFLAPAIADLSVLGNVTLVRSEVQLDEDAGGVQTNQERPLAGQSPFVVNAGLDYANERSGTRARLLYNVAGARISKVGASGLPDEYEQPRHQVDLTVAQRLGDHFDVKVGVENLLDAPVRFTQGGDAVVGEYRTGTTATFSATWSY
jgi:hypothetical protein